VRSAFPALAAAAFVAGVNLRLFDALLPKVADDFRVLPTSASIVVTTFTLAYGLFQIVHGPLGDRMGKLRVIWAATLAAAAASLGSALAPSLRVLAATRFATGIGAAAIIPLALAWLGDNSEFKVRQAVIGRFVGFLLLGQALGPAFGGALAQLFSWREVFFVLAAVFLLVALALFVADRGTRTAASPRPATGVLRVYLRVLGDPWVRTMMLTGFIEGALFFGVFTYAGAYLRERFALSYLAVGAIVACYALGGVVYSLLVRWLLTKMSERWFVGLGAGVLLAFFAGLPLLPAWQAAPLVFLVAGFGFYLLHNTLQTRATEMAPEARGTGLSVFAFSLFTGQAAGVQLGAAGIRTVGYHWTFTGAGLLLLAMGIWFSGRLASRTKEA
jgi:predicted MFS family arabinose efflux permease